MNAANKRKIVRAGRRGAKTTGLAKAAVLGLLNKQRVLYAVPTTDQLTRFWHIVVNALAELIEFGVFKKYEGEKIIERTGTHERIKAKTAWNADTLRGDYADLLILDEFQLMNEDAWKIVGLPMLMDHDGDAILAYTPPSLHSRSNSKATDKRHAAKMYKACLADPRWLCATWGSRDNPYISEEGIAEVSRDMTQLAIRQEILAEDIEEVPGALWKQSMIDALRVESHPQLARIVIGVDPSGGSTNEAGVVACGLGIDGHGYVLRDDSLLAASPRNWAGAAVAAYHELRADRILGERNYGGDMVESTIKTVDDSVSYRDVEASRGKLVRAEPICALYEKGYIHHVGTFEKLEEEMCSYVPGDKKSPNRMDAMVWAFTELFPENRRLGLVEYLMQNPPEGGGSSPSRGPIQSISKVEASKLIKPVTSESTEVCPDCSSKAIVRLAGGQHRCNQCGKQWGTTNVGMPMSRKEYLAK